MALPNALYSTAQVRALDAHAINELGIAGYTLMKRAGEVIVDALLGTGLKGVVHAELAEVIRAINSSGRPVFALDMPSGLDGDAGVPLGEAVRADATVTFVGLKTGLLVGEGPEFAGTVFLDRK